MVVTHNRLVQLQRTLGRLLATPPEQLSAVLVVDNGSSDGTAGWLRGIGDPRLHLHRLEVNAGGAGGFEIGLRRAMADLSPDWVVVMDDDARPDPGALAAFHAADRRGWDAIAAAVRLPDGTICEMNRPTRNPFRDWRLVLGTALRGREAFHLGQEAFAGTQPQPVDGASFVGLFLHRRAIERAGLPDGRLFLYGDDALYTMRLSAMGGRIGFLPGVRFEHDTRTISARDGRFRPLWKVYYYHRNLLLLYRVAAGRAFWLVLPVVLIRWAWRLRNHGGERRAFLRLLGHAVAHGLTQDLGTPHAQVLRWAEAEIEADAPAPKPRSVPAE